MRVRVSYTVNVSDEYRRALRRRVGRKGTATRAEVVNHFIQYGRTLDDYVISENGDEATAKAEAADAGRKAEEGKSPRRRGPRAVGGGGDNG